MNSFETNDFLHLHKTFSGFKTKKNTKIDTKNAIKKDSVFNQSSIKKTSNAKKTISHKLEAQISVYSNTIGDCSINAKLKKEIYESSRKNARKKLKAK